MSKDTITSGGAAIQRYKIGYHAHEWSQRSRTPSGIPDASGSWVRYEDHVNALAAGQATAAPAQPAAQQGVAYAELPTSNYAGRVYEEGFLIGTCPLYTADQMRAFADATHALRASRGKAPATQQAGEPAGTVGYTVHGTQYVNWRTKPPAHGTPLYTTPQPTQAQAAEPVAWLRNTTDPQPHAVTNLKYRSAVDAKAGVEYIPVFAAPQPVAREPLTGGQIKGLIEDGVFFGNCKEIVRAIEAAHGITQKGGQHVS